MTSSIKIIPATELRNNLFEIINWINAERKEVWITKNSETVAKLIPAKRYTIEDIDEIIKRTRGMLKGKKVIFPYQDNKKVIARERKYLKDVREWKIR